MKTWRLIHCLHISYYTYLRVCIRLILLEDCLALLYFCRRTLILNVYLYTTVYSTLTLVCLLFLCPVRAAAGGCTRTAAAC